jgi:hypothetical protein
MPAIDQQGKSIADRLNMAALAEEARLLYVYLLTGGGKPDQDFQQVKEGVREAWENAVLIVAEVCVREVTIGWTELADHCFQHYHGGRKQFSGLKPVQKLAWEIVARHLVNLITAEDAEDVKLHSLDFEPWAKWMIDKLKDKKK